MDELGTASFAARYRLGAADARLAVVSSVKEGAPVLVGLGLLVALCAATTAFGSAGTVAIVAIPAVMAYRLLALYRRAQAAIRSYGKGDLAATFRAAGLIIQTPTSKTELAWAGLYRIRRTPSAWLFVMRSGRYFYIPERAIPPEARAPIVRWATAAKVRVQ